MDYCPFCPEIAHGDRLPSCNYHNPSNALSNNAWYHYQSFVYYYNLYNAQYSQPMAPCECYDDLSQDNSVQFFDSARWSTSPEAKRTPHGRHTNEQNRYFTHQNVNNHENYNDEEEEFEVDESFYQFLQQSQKHRKEREKLKKDSKKTDGYVEVGKKTLLASSLPPDEHQDTKRRKDMERLYGDHASSIMSLEASLQLQFDRYFDERQPVFWPNIPLKF